MNLFYLNESIPKKLLQPSALPLTKGHYKVWHKKRAFFKNGYCSKLGLSLRKMISLLTSNVLTGLEHRQIKHLKQKSFFKSGPFIYARL